VCRYSGPDPYLDPASGVLRNRFGITEAATLEATEADLVAARCRELIQKPLQGRFDLEHLQSIHRYLFGDLYDWAGKLRTVDIFKGGNSFAHHSHIQSAAAAIFTQLAGEQHLAELSPDAFGDRAAYYLSEMNALHPFREGNGRTIREFISALALANGLYISWEKVRPPDFLQASIESFHGDTSKLKTLIRKAIQ
jgi:cell filamentation protein